jgi:hypothetical protein
MILARTAGMVVAAALLAATPSSAGASPSTDTSPPTVLLHRGVVFGVGTVLSESIPNAALPVKLTWTLSDDHGVTRQAAHWESLDHGTVVASGDEDSLTARRVVGVPYRAYGILHARVDAYDAAGNEGYDVAAYYGELVQSDDFTRSAGWTSVACRLCHSQRATLRTTTRGASMQYRFTGHSIALIGDFAANGGSFEVYIDDVRQGTYSQRGAAKKMAVVYQKRFATQATRTVTVVAAGGRVDVDALMTQSANCRC